MENGNWRILVLRKTRIGQFFFLNPEFSFCGKRKLENSRLVEKQNRRIFFFYRRILVLWKTGTGEFSFGGKPESEKFFLFFYRRILVLWKAGTGEFSFGGKPESESFFFFFHPRILVLWKRRILVLWKTGTGEFSFCEKPESENFFFFFFNPEISFYGKWELENSRFVENQNRRIFFFFYRRILVLWKTGTGEFSFCGKPESENFFLFFIREFSFCGKRELENSRFVKNQNRRILFFFLSENSRFVETENSRFVENGNWRILVL